MKRISTHQLAEICGVSQGTVDRALNNRRGISPATRERILAAAREYGYRPNPHARAMAGGKSMLIGVVVFDLRNQYFCDLLTAVEECAAQRGYSIVVMMTDKQPEREVECVQSLYHMEVDGMLLCPIRQGEAYEQYLSSLQIPVITFGNRLDSFPHVGIDDAAAVHEVVSKAVDKGYERLIYVKPELCHNASAQWERLHAFEEAARQAGKTHIVTNVSSAQEHIRPGTKQAFICSTDLYALRLLPAASRYGVGIIGFDNLRMIDQLQLPLDSVAYDVEAAACAAVQTIAEGKPPSGPVAYRLVERGSL